MADEGYKRKLTAILGADVKGYGRMMDDDEEATLRTLTSHRTAFTHLIEAYHGRVVDTPGDYVLAEFPSVVDSVKCAVEIQRELAERNEDLPDDRKMEFRIGINLGDVIEKDGKIYGDGVNIAARMEPLADAGGICISGRVYDQVANKIDLEYEYLGEHEVKNVGMPIRVYRVLSRPGVAAQRVVRATQTARMKWRKKAFGATMVVLIIIVALALWQVSEYSATEDIASADKEALPLPDKPSIAVLPFDNMTDDPKLGYFADGISEDIIRALSKSQKTFVIARNSSFAYKGKPNDIEEIGKDLGVKYVLEGSVRKSEDVIRITAQLIDAKKGAHVWAEKYDRDFGHIFTLQDEITKKIITELQVELTEGEQARIFGKGTNNLEAYLKFLEGRSLVQQLSPEVHQRAKQLFEESIAIDAHFAPAYRWLGAAHFAEVFMGISKSKKDSFGKAFVLAEKAISIDESYGDAYGLLGFLYILQRQYNQGISMLEKALELDPNGADTNTYLAMSYLYLDDLEKALSFGKTAVRHNPIAPSMYLNIMAAIYRSQGNYSEALKWAKRAVAEAPNHTISLVNYCSILVLNGQNEEAKNQAAKVKELNPNFSVTKLENTLAYKNREVKRIYVNALREAGLPD